MPAIVDVRPVLLRLVDGVVVMIEVYRNFRDRRRSLWTIRALETITGSSGRCALTATARLRTVRFSKAIAHLSETFATLGEVDADLHRYPVGFWRVER